MAVLLLIVAAAALLRARGGDTLEAVRPQRGQAVQAVYATGTVEPTVMIPIAPRLGARLAALFADEGHEVAEGAPLGRLEDEDLRKTLEETEIRLFQSKAEYDRRAALAGTGAIAAEAVERAKSDYQAAQAARARARANLDYMRLAAPAAGTIIRRDGEVGEMIPAGQPVFWMSCCAGLRITAEVDEEDIALVRPGQDVAIRADAFPDRIFDGTVRSITPKGDPVARSYRVRIALGGDTPLMIGMTAETNIIIRQDENALLLPAGAVEDGAAWLVRDGRLARRAVETGARSSAFVEIRDGLGEDDIVLRDPAGAGAEEGRAVQARLRDWHPG